MYGIKSVNTLVSDYDATLDFLDFKHHDGFVFKVNQKYHIVIDEKLNIQERRFAIAHEIGHIVDDSIGDEKSGKYAEQNANEIAIQILVSDAQIEEVISDGYNDIPTMSTIFGIPYKWMEKRLQQFLENKS